MTYPNLKDKSE